MKIMTGYMGRGEYRLFLQSKTVGGIHRVADRFYPNIETPAGVRFGKGFKTVEIALAWCKLRFNHDSRKKEITPCR